MSGNWQDADPARTIEGLAQFPPTVRTWTVYSGPDLLSDADLDGVAALTELALGMDPTATDGRNGSSGLPTVTFTPEGDLDMNLQVPQNLAAAQGHGIDDVVYTVQASSNLVAWEPVATKLTNAAWSGSASVTVGAAVNGLVPVTIRDNAPTTRRFMRLAFTYVP